MKSYTIKFVGLNSEDDTVKTQRLVVRTHGLFGGVLATKEHPDRRVLEAFLATEHPEAQQAFAKKS